MTEPQRLASYVQPALSEARIESQWSRIVERQPKHAWQRAAYTGGVLALAMAVLLVFGWMHRSPGQDPLPQELVVQRDAQSLQSLSFPEGLTVTLQREARCRVIERSRTLVHLQLEQGVAEFEVKPDKARTVVVTAAGFDVDVVGTHFEVALLGRADKPDVSVRVQRGTVRVRSRGAPSDQAVIRTLTAGESWVTRTDTNAPAASASTELDSTVPPSPAPEAGPSAISAKGLFEQAEAHRLKGHAREAAVALDRLRRNFPNDPRAGLASFELGRLRMDHLGDPAGALNAFSDAVRLDPRARFREDAEARVVQLYAGRGQIERCLKAQAEYQSRYPNGPHAKVVAASCRR